MNTGLDDGRLREITLNLRDLGACGKIILFGSRAKGTWREGSDIDIAAGGDGIDELWAAHARDILEDRFFPYSFDIVALSALSDDSLREHIDRVGIDLSGYETGHSTPVTS